MQRYTDIPLPATRFVPGSVSSGPRPAEGHLLSPEADDPGEWSASRDFLFGVDLFNAGFCWEAHEALEFWWKALLSADHDRAASVVRGLIQTCAARIKRELGNEAGVQTLVERANASFAAAEPGEILMGLDVGSWWPAARSWLEHPTGVFPQVVLTPAIDRASPPG